MTTSPSVPIQICVAYDLFRCPALEQWDPAGNASWLGDFIAPALHAVGATVSGLNNDAIANARKWLHDRLLTGACSAGTNGWCELYSAPSQRASLDDALSALLLPDIIVGYELSANQMFFLASHGRTFIDVSIDPVRFTKNMFFRVRTNNPKIASVLRQFHISDADLAGEAGFFRAHLARIQRSGLTGARDLVFVGQVDVDTSLICDGRIATVCSHLSSVTELLHRHDRMILQPHPLAHSNDDIAVLLGTFPHAVLGRSSVYHAVCHPETVTVATLSSSVADEASILGKTVVRLICPDASPQALGSNVSSQYFRIDKRLSSAALWGMLIWPDQYAAPARFAAEAACRGLDGSALRTELGVFAAATITPMRHYELPLSGHISMAEQGNVNTHCVFGWSTAESVGVWSIKPVVAISFDAPAQARALELTFCAFIGPVRRALDVELILNRSGGSSAVTQCYSFGDENEYHVTMPLPSPGAAGRCDLTIRLMHPCSPASLNVSGDTRELGICLSRLRIVTTNISSPGASNLIWTPSPNTENF